MFRALFLFFFLAVASAESPVLLKKGWYRTESKGVKMQLHDVKYLDRSTVPDMNYLRISGRIPTLFKGSIRDFSKLRNLKLTFCAIVDILPGAFENLTSLETIEMSDNDIEHVQGGVFNFMGVKTLYLHRNQIETIDKDAFDNMPKLNKIKLNSNRILEWNPDWFYNTPSLKKVFLRRNSIEKLPGKAFKNLKGNNKVPDTEIYLSKNNISYVSPDALAGIVKVYQLWLDRNELTQLDAKIFSHITNISVLVLSKNKLTGLPDSMFSRLKSNLKILDISGNHNIRSLPYEVAQVVDVINIQNIRNFDCNSLGQLLSKLAKENKTCEIETDCANVRTFLTEKPQNILP